MKSRDQLIDVGFNSFIIKDRVKAIFSPNDTAMKKMKVVAGQEQMIINLSFGFETKSIILMDSGHVIQSVISVPDFIGLVKEGK